MNPLILLGAAVIAYILLTKEDETDAEILARDGNRGGRVRGGGLGSDNPNRNRPRVRKVRARIKSEIEDGIDNDISNEDIEIREEA